MHRVRREPHPPAFADRQEAGRLLAEELRSLDLTDPVVLGLPRGGVPVAYEVATALMAPLDVLVVRKLGAPGQPELAIGAIGEGGVRVLNDKLIRQIGVGEGTLALVEERERQELVRRAKLYRRERERVDLQGSTAIVVDDGIATGATARAGCRIARAQGAAIVVLAVPVAPHGWSPGEDADRLVAVVQPRDLRSVGGWYRNFSQTSDAQVTSLLRMHTPND